MLASSWSEREGSECVCACVFVCAVGGEGGGGTEARQAFTNRLVQHHDGVLLVRGGNGKRRRVEFWRGLN